MSNRGTSIFDSKKLENYSTEELKAELARRERIDYMEKVDDELFQLYEKRFDIVDIEVDYNGFGSEVHKIIIKP